MAFAFRSCLVATVLMAGFSTSAGAACPEPGDLATGIAMRDDSGGVTVFRPGSAPGEVTETTLFDDNTGFFVRSVGGLLVQETHDIENGVPVEGSVIETALEAGDAAFPVAEGRRIEVTGTERGSDGVQTGVVVTIETSLMRQVLYGDCVVQAIPVKMHYAYDGQPAEVEFLDYLPEFGISLFLGAGEVGRAPDIYRIVDLFKAPPE